MQPTVGSLFSGAGGFDIGFDRAGFALAWQVEIDPTARDVLARHWPDVERHEDVRTVGKKNLAPVDVVVGGFPCQDVSVAGKGKGLSGARSGLFYEMARVIRELRPACVVWENVPGLRSNDGGRHRA
jgi:DNA (cytosine-5)-methyltransferase 1